MHFFVSLCILKHLCCVHGVSSYTIFSDSECFMLELPFALTTPLPISEITVPFYVDFIFFSTGIIFSMIQLTIYVTRHFVHNAAVSITCRVFLGGCIWFTGFGMEKRKRKGKMEFQILCSTRMWIGNFHLLIIIILPHFSQPISSTTFLRYLLSLRII